MAVRRDNLSFMEFYHDPFRCKFSSPVRYKTHIHNVDQDDSYDSKQLILNSYDLKQKRGF